MCVDASHASGAPQSVAEALRMARSAADYLNTPEAAGLDGTACGEALIALGEIQAKLAAAHMEFLRRFDAADAHDADGYGTTSAWLAAKTRISRKDARAKVRDMRRLTQRPLLRAALAAGDISKSWAATIEEWTRKLPEAMREETDKILLQAIAGGADQDDLATIAGLAIEKWRQQRPDEDDEDRFNDRFVRFGTTFAGAGVIRGDLTPECAAAVTAVFDALGKKRGKEDRRTQDQRYHDALQEACKLLIGARMVPDRAGADTQTVVHIGLSQLRDLPGASELEDAWIRAKLGEPGYLAGKDAEVAACDSMTVPVVTGHADMTVIDKIIDLVLAAHAPDARRQPMSPGARQAHRYAIARLAVDFVSGPGGLASALRTGLLEPPVQHAEPAARYRALRLDPGPHPPCRHPARPALRMARRLRPPGRRQRRPPPDAQERRRPDQRPRLRAVLRVSPRNLHPPLGLAGHPPPRRHLRSHQPRRQANPAKTPAAH